jgi:uncharacterized protein (TIGR02611 family)
MGTKPPTTRGPSPRRAEDDGFPRTDEAVVASPRADGAADRSTTAAVAAEVKQRVRPEPPVPAWRERVRATLRIIRSNPTGRIALKVTVGIAGALVVAVGLVLIPLPGPGWALVILGLAIWAIEFVWAKHLLRFTRARVQQWTQWVKRQSWPVRLLLGLVGMVFIGTVLVLSLRYSFGVDLVGEIVTYVTTH